MWFMRSESPGMPDRPIRRAAWGRAVRGSVGRGPRIGPGGRRRLHGLASSGRGRDGLAIGIDIGGTKVAAGVVDADGNVVEEARRSTPGTDPRAVERVIVDLVRELGEGRRIASVGIGAAGWMDLDGGIVLFSPHLAW